MTSENHQSEFSPQIIQRIYSLIKDNPAYQPRAFREGALPIDKALESISDTTALFIGEGAIQEAGEMFERVFPGHLAVIVSDSDIFPIAGEALEASLRASQVEIVKRMILSANGLNPDYELVTSLLEQLKKMPQNTVPVALGAGTINDVVKLAAHLAGRRYMCIPTAASMDGYTAYGASIWTNGIKQMYPCPGPLALLADMDIIAAAPEEMTRSGYVDLISKMTSGADWILSDWMGMGQISEKAWKISQGGFQEALMRHSRYPDSENRTAQIKQILEGLILSGFAMQIAHSDLPAFGAAHLLCDIWQFEHIMKNGKPVSYGRLMSISVQIITAFYNKLILLPFEDFDMTEFVRNWPSAEQYEEKARMAISRAGLQNTGIQRARAKYVTREQLSLQLQQLKEYWPDIRDRLTQQIIPLSELRGMLRKAGLPITPDEVGIDLEHLKRSIECAPFIGKHFTILDLMSLTGQIEINDSFYRTKIYNA